MFPYVGQVQILGIKRNDYPAKGDKAASIVYELDFYVPGEGAGKARLFDDAQRLSFEPLVGKTIKAKISQSIYKGFPQYRVEALA